MSITATPMVIPSYDNCNPVVIREVWLTSKYTSKSCTILNHPFYGWWVSFVVRSLALMCASWCGTLGHLPLVVGYVDGSYPLVFKLNISGCIEVNCVYYMIHVGCDWPGKCEIALQIAQWYYVDMIPHVFPWEPGIGWMSCA